MNVLILNKEVQEFINSHLDHDITSLILKGSPFENILIQEIVEQIEAKKKGALKLPTWFHSKFIYYPNKLNIAQTSSEETADYKAQIIKGQTMIDLSGGFGVDSFFFSKYFSVVIHCEINSRLSAIAKHNYEQLLATNVEAKCTDGIEFLQLNKDSYDWIYIDPSRRHDTKGKVFFLRDCLPNVPKHLKMLFEHTSNIMIKTSPLLDLSIGIEELMHVQAIYVVAVKNEVKELVWLLKNNYSGPIQIRTANLKTKSIDQFNFIFEDEGKTKAKYSLPLDYLYEPNSAILKAGGFNSISQEFNLFKLHQHSHLYTSDHLINFPGRRFKIIEILLYNKSILKKRNFMKANITTRNFPETVQQIRKKLVIKDGGNQYLFFTTNSMEQKIVIVCTKAI